MDSDYVYSYVYQVKLITNQTLCPGYDRQDTKPNDPEFMLHMFRYAILELDQPKPAEHLAQSLMQKLFEQAQELELNNNNIYSFFKIEPVSDNLKSEMFKKITDLAEDTLVKAKDDPCTIKQFFVRLTVKGRKPGDGYQFTGQSSCSGGDDDVVRGLQCVICRDEFENINGVTKLNCECKHLYHDGCIWKWLQVNHSCPTCRFNFALTTKRFAAHASEWLPELREMKRNVNVIVQQGQR